MSIQQNIGLVIVAAGRGERAGNGNGPKQYASLGKSTVIAQSLKCFEGTIAPYNTAIAIHEDDKELFDLATADVNTDDMMIVFGGSTRQQSAYAGLKALAEQNSSISHVMIHDAARPFLEQTVLDELLEIAGAYPNDGILPTIVIAETLKTVDEGLVSGTASRDNMHRAQTPQMFPFDAILDAHAKAELHSELSFTDDAAVFEWIGLPVRVVPGDASNFKITYPEDFPKDEVMSSLPDVRTGNGYDVHVFGPGDKVVLCGIDIPFEKSLVGHSDADVGLHALTDALLATCGAGDIGDHFPPTDPKWKGVESHVFLNHAVELVAKNGGTIMNADVTLVAEAPKISPYRLQMRERLSEILGIDLQRCSVKATTNEKMGFVGRSEGIMALATASVVYGEVK
ncbi:MAG: bifunctional 2-C-methyl-D-erythritol 4-phosphate cytidylyltransferase/2-C-methyl-D-erythritol 2,4-cyclodiphosphate synthase [Pseudomonadota bacterium]